MKHACMHAYSLSQRRSVLARRAFSSPASTYYCTTHDARRTTHDARRTTRICLHSRRWCLRLAQGTVTHRSLRSMPRCVSARLGACMPPSLECVWYSTVSQGRARSGVVHGLGVLRACGLVGVSTSRTRGRGRGRDGWGREIQTARLGLFTGRRRAYDMYVGRAGQAEGPRRSARAWGQFGRVILDRRYADDA
ncbi:hypothetical protein PYCCODRAFT_1029870 [Trametes coccinea BRFM310]|uniref:Uncharacterized protein n=1 Tax=Trametes coccinea (strain BRFM310) TaxID=1353009 RepID=A0A1Y2IAB8_TRAC3|nr:hypothetical protein PYCCODRAFT_1029870 [Trametes coccinea BRFM310]